jgi:hypothetical protein
MDGLLGGCFFCRNSTSPLRIDWERKSFVDLLSHIPKTDNSLGFEDQFRDEHLFVVTIQMPWYVDVVNYLTVWKLPVHLSSRERKLIFQHSARFTWIGGYLFHIGFYIQIEICIREDEVHDVLKACHDEPCGRHFADHKSWHKVLHMGYYWHSIFKDAKKYV